MTYLTSDLQFIAQMLIKTRQDNQITEEETARLKEIAGEGHTTGEKVPDGSQL